MSVAVACECAEEVQARLALRALWAPPAAAASAAEDGTAELGPCTLHRAVHGEVEATLRSSLARRTARLTQALEVLGPAAAGSGAPAAVAAAAPTPPPQNGSAQVSTKLLAGAAARAIQAADAAAKPQPKAYGPTPQQLGLPEPPEKDEEVLAESATLEATLESLEKICGARERQIGNLREQYRQLEEIRKEHEKKAAATSEKESELVSDKSLAMKEHATLLGNYRKQVGDLTSELERKTAEVKRYSSLVRQQKRFIIQSDRLSMGGFARARMRHPAGDVALVLPPPKIGDDERLETYDVGTAIANPYVVDSWPFEPNVLAARREITEPLMQPFEEESTKDLQDEILRLPRRCTGLPLRDDEDENDWGDDSDSDEDDGREGPGGTSTARSL